MILRFFILPVLLLAAFLTSGLQAQVPQISTSLSARSLTAGQQAVLSYQITGALQSLEEYPQTIDAAGLAVTFSGITNRLVSVNGVSSREMSLRYTVQAREAGLFEVPAQAFMVDGKVLEAPAVPVTVTVNDGVPVDDKFVPTVQISLGKTEFWLGEVVPVQVAILVHPAVQPLSQFFPQVKTPNFAVNRFDRSAGIEAREVDGQIWRAWQMESVFTALKSGVQDFGPAELKAEVMMPLAGVVPDPFGQQRGDRRTLQLASNVVPVTVKELPPEGKPDNFSGAVGTFEIELQASPLSLNAGDPIAVEIAVNGTGNFDAVTAPRLEKPEGWRLYEPRISQENRAWGTEPGRKTFTQIMIPEQKHGKIPSFVLSYFDPVSGKYVERRSAPVALSILGEFKPANAPPAEAKDFAAAADADAPVEELGDIIDRPLTGSPWLALATPVRPVSPWLLHGVPAVLLGLLVCGGLLKRATAAAAARRPPPGTPRLPARILADLRQSGQDQRQFYQLVQEFLTALSWHRPEAGGAVPNGITSARDRWLYGPDDAAAHQPVPDGVKRETLEVLGKL